MTAHRYRLRCDRETYRREPDGKREVVRDIMIDGS